MSTSINKVIQHSDTVTCHLWVRPRTKRTVARLVWVALKLEPSSSTCRKLDQNAPAGINDQRNHLTEFIFTFLKLKKPYRYICNCINLIYSQNKIIVCKKYSHFKNFSMRFIQHQSNYLTHNFSVIDKIVIFIKRNKYNLQINFCSFLCPLLLVIFNNVYVFYLKFRLENEY